MLRTLSFVVFEDEKVLVTRCLDVEVASEGDTKDEAVANLREALELYFEDGSTNFSTLPTRTYQFGEITVEA